MPGAAWRLCFYLSRLCFFSYNSYVLPYSGILYIGHCQYVLCKTCWLIKLKDFMLVQPNCLFNSCRCCNWDYHLSHEHANYFPGTSCNVSCFHKGSCRLLQALLHYPSWGSGKKIEASLYQELYIIRLKVVCPNSSFEYTGQYEKKKFIISILQTVDWGMGIISNLSKIMQEICPGTGNWTHRFLFHSF